MAKERKFDFAPLPLVIDDTNEEQDTNVPTSKVEGPPTKVTFECDFESMEKMKDYGYWEGLTQKDIILESLRLYFEDKEIRPRPEKIKQRPKVGRKPKNQY